MPPPQTYRILIFDRTNVLHGVFTDVRSFSFKDVVNGGSAEGNFVLFGSLTSSPTTAIVANQFSQTNLGAPAFPLPISYGWRVQFYLADSINPWYDGRISGFDPQQSDNEDDEYITVQTEGWFNHLDDGIVTETLSPGIQPNGINNGVMYADTYLSHLLSTYKDASVFGSSYGVSPITPATGTPAGAIPIILSALQFDGEGLGSCIDDICKQLLSNTGNTYEWWVRGLANLGLAVVIQPNQNPNSITQGRIAPTPATVPVHFVTEFKNSTIGEEEIQNTIDGLYNMIALYGGRDPQTQLQVYQPYQDSISISLYGLRQQKVTNNNLLTEASMTNYAAAYLLINGYPQPQATYRGVYPTDARRAGTWVQLIEPGFALTAPQAIKQMRMTAVETTLDTNTDQVYQRVTAAAPRAFIDKAYYGALQQAQNLIAVSIARGASLGRYYYVASGGDWLSTSNTLPTTVSISKCYAFFGTPLEYTVSANPALQLADYAAWDPTTNAFDGATGGTGDGAYEVAFVIPGTPPGGYALYPGITTPSLVCSKVSGLVTSNGSIGRIPSNLYVQRLWQFIVINGTIAGATDLRVIAIPPRTAPPGATFRVVGAFNAVISGSTKAVTIGCTFTLTPGLNIGDGSWINNAVVNYFYNDTQNPQIAGKITIPTNGFPTQIACTLPPLPQNYFGLIPSFSYIFSITLAAADGTGVSVSSSTGASNITGSTSTTTTSGA